MKFFTSVITLIFLLLISSCNEEEIDWPFNSDPSELIVVEAVLTNEKTQHVIKLSKPYQKQNLTPKPVSEAIVFIETNDNPPELYVATETPVGSGLYLTDILRAVSGKEYKLTIQYNNVIYNASDIQPPVETMDIFKYHLVSDSLYTLNFNEFGTEPNYIKYMLDWQTTDGCTIPINCKAEIIYYDLKNTDVIKQFKPNQEQVNFPTGTTVIRKKHSVSNAYKEYLRGMLSETAWRGGFFDVYPANAPTNLSEGAIGFFAVSTVVSDTTIIID